MAADAWPLETRRRHAISNILVVAVAVVVAVVAVAVVIAMVVVRLI